MRSLAILTAAMVVAAACPAQSVPVNSTQYDLAIERQSLSTALQEFATQSGVQIIFFSKVTDGYEAPPVKGKFTASDALQRLLNDSSLTFREINEKTIEVQPKAVANGYSQVSTAGSAARSGAIRLAQSDSNGSGNSSSTTQTSDQDDRITEVVVTAEKREQSLATVPSSITALTGAAIQEQGLSSVQEYQARVPALYQQSSGAPGYGQVVLRGVGAGRTQTVPTVVFYLDDVAMSTSITAGGGPFATPDPDLADISRIEVIRGPQSTLYGAGALGGVIRLVTNKPKLDTFEGDVRGEYTSVAHGGQGYSFRGALNAPLIDNKLAMRLVAFTREDAGYIDNVFTGSTDVNSSRTTGGRVSFKFKPSDPLDIDAALMFNETRSDGLGFMTLTGRTTGTPGLTGDYTVHDPVQAYGDLKQFATIDGFVKNTNRLASVTASYDFGAATLTSSTAYNLAEYDAAQDYNGYNRTAYNLATARGYAFPDPRTTTTIVTQDPEQRKFSEELRLVSAPNEHLEWLAAGYFTDEKAYYHSDVYALSRFTGEQVPGPAGVVYLPCDCSYESMKTYAAFGNLTYYVTPNFDIQGGVRYSDYDRVTLAGPIDGYLQAPTTTTARVDAGFDAVTYLVAMRWRPTEKLNVYFRTADAYRPGGLVSVANPTPFKADTLTNYELGLKWRGLDGRVSAEVAAYHMLWNDIQLNSIVNGISTLANGGNATIDGAEFDISVLPINGLRLSVNGAYNDGRISSIDAGTSAATGIHKDDEMPNTPRWAFAGSAEYTMPVSNEWSAVLGASFVYQGEKPTDFPNTTNTNVIIPSYDTVDLRAGLSNDRYSLLLRVSNLGDTRGFSSTRRIQVARDPLQAVPFADGFYAPLLGYVITPRTISLSLAAKF